MADIWRELSDISMASFAWALRDPMRFGLIELSKAVGFSSTDYGQFEEVIGNYSRRPDVRAISTTGDGVIMAFINWSLYLRSLAGTSAVDLSFVEMATEYLGESKGPIFKKDIFRILKGIMDGINSSAAETPYEYLSDKMGTVTIVAGNNSPMFKSYNESTTGLELRFPEDIGRTTMVVRVENVLTGEYQEIQYTSMSSSTGVILFTDDALTNMIDPGIIRVTVKDPETGALLTNIEIRTAYCKFGMTPAERMYTLTDADFTYTEDMTDPTGQRSLRYISNYDRVKTPATLDGDPFLSVGYETFMEKDVTAVKIQAPVTTIE